MIPVSRAITIVDDNTATLGVERIELAISVGRILRENIIADGDLPPFDRSQMDGYAVVAADTKAAPVDLKVVGESAAGKGWHKMLKPGEAVRIMTGAPIPKGADAVQKVEMTREIDGKVAIVEQTDTGRYIVRKGSEIKQGVTIFRSGAMITENMIAAIAAFGYSKVKVAKQPRVAILGTGSEIVEIHKKPGRDQIRNSNSVMLQVLSRKFGADATILPNVSDDISDLRSEIKKAAKGVDILVITGGVSVGKYDFTKAALRDLGAEIFIEKIRLKPGKPMVFARLGNTLIFGLPGNPVSAAVTFHLFVRKAILRMQGAATTDLKKGFAVLAADVRAARERDTYLPSRLETNKSGQLVALPLKWQGSSDFIGFAQADSLIFLPKGKALEKGDVAQIVYL
ncbi:MAG: gephyrin-like molybdotransferase Glp [Pyrinomonadaceae bacterium]